MKQLLKKTLKISFLILAISFLGCDEDDAILPEAVSGYTFTLNEDSGTVTFINTSEDARNYLWTFGDGTTSTEINPIKTFAPGTYTVTLEVSNVAGATDSFEVEIIIPGAVIIPLPTTLALPITFDDSDVDYAGSIEGAFSVVDNPALGGANNVASKVGAIENAGAQFEAIVVNLDTPVDFSTDKTITLKLWSESVLPILLKFEGGVNAERDNEVVVNHGGTGWEELSFDFANDATTSYLDNNDPGGQPFVPSGQYATMVIFVDGPGTTAGIFYLDDIAQVASTGGGECTAETAESLSAADFNLTFMSDPGSSIGSFDALLTTVANPDADNTINTSCQVGQIDRNGGALFANNQIDLDAKLDFSANAGFKMKVWSPVAGTNVLLKLEDQAGIFSQIDATTATANAWEELTFPFAINDNGKYDKIILFFELNTNTTETYYIDDLALYAREDGGVSTEANLITNGGFETGDATGWETGIAGNNGTFTVTSAISKCDTYSANIAVNSSQLQIIRQANIGVGVVTPNSEITLSFDLRGNAGPGGEFIPILFSESTTDGVTKTDLLDGPLIPADTWTRYTFTTTTGPDVSNGVSLLLQSVCGAVDGCVIDAYIDNVFIALGGAGGPECDGGTTGGDDTEAPNAITDLAASNTTATTTTLGWTAPTDNVGVTNYEVFQGGISIATTGATTYNVGGLSPLTAYAFTVFAQDASGNVSAVSNSANITTLDGSVDEGNLAVNGDFETGDTSGWSTFVDAEGATFTVTNAEAACGSFSGNLVADFEAGVGGPVDALIKQANIGIGTVTPNSQVTISFDLRGSLAGAGGVFFAEIFSEVTGGGTSKAEILSGGPLFPTDTWTRYSYTVTTGNDVSAGVTLQLKSSVGPNPGSAVDAFIDNVYIGMGTTSGPDCEGTGTGGNGGAGLNFESTSVTVNEDAGTASFTARLNGDVSGGFTVDYATADGTAAQPGDYTSTSGTLTFAGTNGESYDIDVPIVDDILAESQEGFLVNLSNISNTAITINSPQATGNITDNDGGAVIEELTTNGDFETGDISGWTTFVDAQGASFTASSAQANGGTFSGNLLADFEAGVGGAVDAVVKQANIGIGTVAPNTAVIISFDLFGSFTDGGVFFAEFFSELAGGGVSKAEILSGGPLFPNGTWTTYTYTVTTGPDVAGGITLQLKSSCGPVAGCVVDAYIDNVTVKLAN